MGSHGPCRLQQWIGPAHPQRAPMHAGRCACHPEGGPCLFVGVLLCVMLGTATVKL